MKAVIVDDQRPDGGRLLENAEFCASPRTGVSHSRVSPVSRADQGQGRAAGPLPPRQFLYGRTFLGDARSRRSVRALARGRRQCARARHDRASGPRDRFDATSRSTLQPLAARPYRSLVLAAAARRRRAPTRRVPHVAVERRALAHYAALLARRPHERRHACATASAPSSPICKMPGALEALDDILRRVDGGRARPPADAMESAARQPHHAPQSAPTADGDALRAIAGREDASSDFDFSFQPSITREQLESLHTLGFLERRENVVFLGPPGVGKTHLAISLAIAAARTRTTRLLRDARRSHHVARRRAAGRATSRGASARSSRRASWSSTRSAICRSRAPARSSSFS